jgi:L-threonylcarbamoyladenylate synthase
LTPDGALRGADASLIRDILVVRGGYALIPSDTCYSIAAIPSDRSKTENINLLLKRGEMPISLAFDDVDRLGRWVQLRPHARYLLDRFTPGPLTLVCRLKQHLLAELAADSVAPPDSTLGVRISDSAIERQLVTVCGSPITTVPVMDANGSAVVDFDLARAIVEEGMEFLDSGAALAVVEGRRRVGGVRSTVVRIPEQTERLFEIIREGEITESDIWQALSEMGPQN